MTYHEARAEAARGTKQMTLLEALEYLAAKDTEKHLERNVAFKPAPDVPVHGAPSSVRGGFVFPDRT